MNWNNPQINGFPGQPFISRDNFKLYSLDPNYELLDIEGLSDSDVENAPQAEKITGIAVNEKTANTVKSRQNKLQPKFVSNLTSDQHIKFLELCSKFCHRPPTSPEEQKELNMLKELKDIVSWEQNEFMKYLRNVAEMNANKYLILSKNAIECHEKYAIYQKKRLLRYPQFYVLINAVSLAIPSGINHNFIFHRIAVLLEMGNVPKLVMPNIENLKCILPCHPYKISQMFFSEDGQENEFIDDPNIEKLAAEFGANIAMSYSTFECLFDNHSPQFNRQWEMPVTVKNGLNGQKLVVMGDSFATKNMTTPEKNCLFNGFALKSFVLHPNHGNYFSLETWRENPCKMNQCIWDAVDAEEIEDDRRCPGAETPNGFDLFDGGDDQLSKLEQGPIAETLPPLSETEDEEEEAGDLVIDCPPLSPIVSYDGQNDHDDTAEPPRGVSTRTNFLRGFANASRQLVSSSALQTKPQSSSKESCNNSPGSNSVFTGAPLKKMKLDCDTEPSSSPVETSAVSAPRIVQEAKPVDHSDEVQKQRPGKKMPGSFDIPHEMPLKTCDGYEGPPEGNVFYTMWKMGKLHILLKDSYLGYYKFRKFGQLVDVFTKVEYQKEHGFEQLTLSELARIWLALHIKPAVKQVHLFRVDALTSEVLKVEKISKENLNYNFQKCFMQIEIILKTCAELDVGTYLVSHTQGNAHFQVKKGTSKQGGAYSLHLAHNQPEAPLGAHETVERHWMPIDLNVPGRFTPVTRIPCTFEPRDLKKQGKKKTKKS